MYCINKKAASRTHVVRKGYKIGHVRVSTSNVKMYTEIR